MNSILAYDNSGKPSMMVRIPKFKVSDVIPGGRQVTHPAFIIDGVEVPEIYISKYQNIIANERAYSLPLQKPAVNVTFDEARKACEAKGADWHLMTNAEWAAVALWAMKNGTLPRGNNDWGSDYEHKDEKGIVFGDSKVLTGSGPVAWAHDHTQDGIYDLNGNVFEWVGGLRLLEGEIQVIPDNNAAKHLDQSPESNLWQPVKANGETIKYTEIDAGIKLTTDKPKGWNGCRFTDLKSDIMVPDLLKELALYPVDNMRLTDYFGADTEGERLPLRGGYWHDGSHAGVFALNLGNPRSSSAFYVGFRSALVNL